MDRLVQFLGLEREFLAGRVVVMEVEGFRWVVKKLHGEKDKWVWIWEKPNAFGSFKTLSFVRWEVLILFLVHLYIILYPKHHIDPYNPKVTVSVVRYHRAHPKSPVEILVLRFERSFRFDRTRWRDHYVGGIWASSLGGGQGDCLWWYFHPPGGHKIPS